MSLRLKRKTVREISGSWIDFYQPSPPGEYWNETTLRFSARDWEEKVAEMAALRMDVIVVGATVFRGKSFYPSSVVPERWNHACDDPLEAVLSAADRFGMQVFLGAGDATRMDADETERRWREEIPRELHERYGRHRSFQGWYLPVEASIAGHFPDEYIAYANEMARLCRAPDPRRQVLISPSGTRTIEEGTRFIEQLKKLEVDQIAYQDEVGVRKSEPADLAEIFGRLARLHDQAGRPLWATLEIFAFEGATYGSALLPAPFSRVKTQLETISPHVGKMLCYQYLGLMNPGASKAFAGHPSSANFHHDYHEWRCEQAARLDER
jgi:hypothetical protein